MIDFHLIHEDDLTIHCRLLNWARWASGSTGRGSMVTPMFRLYRSGDVWAEPDRSISIPVDTLDGQKLEREVSKLPEKHCAATRWNYVYSQRGMTLWKACRTLSVRPDTLDVLIRDSRALLKSRMLDKA